MDALDEKILAVLIENARTTVKDIAKHVALTSPAVSHRIHRMEQAGVITGYTVRINPALTQGLVRAIISIYVLPHSRDAFQALVRGEPAVEECYQVTGEQSYMVKANCKDMAALGTLVNALQQLGQTNTQIILSTVRGHTRQS